MHIDTVILVLIEVLIVIGMSRLIRLAFRWIKQPVVIGEIVAGIMLGPSLFGWLAPNLAATLFPPSTVPFLNILSQVGLIFFMFLIGLELDPKYLKGKINVAFSTIAMSVLVQFALATLLALLLYPLLSHGNVSFTAFALFLASATSMTAFPVLTRIITEKKLQATRLGTLALTSAAVNDLIAWCLLALGIAVAREGNIVEAWHSIIALLLYIGFMVTVGRSFLQRLAIYYRRRRSLNKLVLALIYMGVVASALITQIIGIHLIFGAFLLGTIMPKNAALVREIRGKTEGFVLIVLLPVFFADSGLRTQIGLVNRPELWLLCGLVLFVAIAGKYIGTYVAARFSGIEKREASALGWLMNTRGLTELIVLNIGLSLGVITPLLFTMLVMVTLVTTFMTSPLLEWIYPTRLIGLDVVEKEDEPEASREIATEDSYGQIYRILVPVANPSTQKGLVQLAVAIALNYQQPTAVHPLSLIELSEDYTFESTPVEANRLVEERRQQLEELIDTLEPPSTRSYVHPIIRISSNVARETAEIAELETANLILVGWHRPAFSNNRLGGRVGQILTTAPVDVAVFIDRGKKRLENLLVPYSANIHDDLALILALRLLRNRDTCLLKILQVVSENRVKNEMSYELHKMMEQLPQSVRDRIDIKTIESSEPIQAVVKASERVDLTIAGTSRAWGIERQTLGRYTDELAIQCRSSLLITRRYSQVTPVLASVLADANTHESALRG
ncbi:MAG: cation:proton antiporter [Tolypothrix brevis GSE-NOS-MK-07-07A]|jgi:Kef-type K+ transport system membrane component KefB/nucleotide-binding universal stress UspA family protein|nr:cation:proton antiporter [Tolypothrix brevis GSE-NOS-MK-07-07A]